MIKKMNRLMGDSLEGTTAMSAALGGTISSLSGGSFKNGAMTAAFAHLYNDRGDHWRSDLSNEEASYLREEALKLRQQIGDLGSEQEYSAMFPNQTNTMDWRIGVQNMDDDLRKIGIYALNVNVKNVAKSFYSGSISPLGNVVRGARAIYQLRSIGQMDGLGIGCNGKQCEVYRE